MSLDPLPVDKKQAMAKALMDLNFSATEIAETLGIHRVTVYRYAAKPVNGDLLQFATEIKTLFALKQNQLVAKILEKISEIIEKTDDIRGLILAYQVLKQHTPSLYEIKKEHDEHELLDSL